MAEKKKTTETKRKRKTRIASASAKLFSLLTDDFVVVVISAIEEVLHIARGEETGRRKIQGMMIANNNRRSKN